MHVGRPGEARRRLGVAGDDAERLLAHGAVVALRGHRIGEGLLHKLRFGHREHVEDVAALAVADLDADRIGEHEPRHPHGRLHRDRRRNPGAERDPHHQRLLEVELLHGIEVEIGEVVDGGQRRRQLGAAEAGMRRRHQPAAVGKQRQHRGGRLDADMGMEEQDRAAAAAVDQLELRPVDRDRRVGRNDGFGDVHRSLHPIVLMSSPFVLMRSRVSRRVAHGYRRPTDLAMFPHRRSHGVLPLPARGRGSG